LIKIKEKGGEIRTRNDAILNKKRLKRNKKGGKEGKRYKGRKEGRMKPDDQKNIYIKQKEPPDSGIKGRRKINAK